MSMFMVALFMALCAGDWPGFSAFTWRGMFRPISDYLPQS